MPSPTSTEKRTIGEPSTYKAGGVGAGVVVGLVPVGARVVGTWVVGTWVGGAAAADAVVADCLVVVGPIAMSDDPHAATHSASVITSAERRGITLRRVPT
jgi:hypothetical protein